MTTTAIRNLSLSLALCTVVLGSSGCTVIGDIFKAGVWVGVLAVVALLGVVGALVYAVSPKK